MQEEAKKEGIDLKFADAQGKEEEQLKAVRSFIAQKVDAIIIAPVVVTGWDQVLEEAKKAGIPVFLADRDVDVADKSLFVTRISADFNLEGRLAGAWLAAGEQGQMQHRRTARHRRLGAGDERKKGFEAVISNFPNMKIVKTQSGNFTTDGGKQVMEAFIKSTDNLKGICGVFAHNDNMHARRHSGDEGSRLEARQGLPDGLGRLRAGGEGSACRRGRERVGRATLGDRQIHLSGRDPVPQRQERAAEVGGYPVRPAYSGDAGRLSQATREK